MTTIAVLLVLAGLYYAAKKTERPHAPPAPKDRLDVPLLMWNDSDAFTSRHLLQSVSVMGASGSGKTSAVGRRLGRALAACKDVAMLIIASKPEDRAMWEGIAASGGRELVVFGPNEPHRFNLIENESKAGDSRETTKCIMTATESLMRIEGRPAEPFWIMQEERLLYNGLEVIKQGFGVADPWGVQSFINSAPTKPEQIESGSYRKGDFYKAMMAADSKPKTSIQHHDYKLAIQYWMDEYPNMAEQTRSGVIAGVMGRLHVFNTGIVQELIGNATTITPEAFDRGAWVLVDMPVSIYGASGSVVAGAWKYATQKHILRRAAGADTPVCCIWIDEYQDHITAFDAHYNAQCRSHLGCAVTLTQSLHSFFSSIGGTESQSKTKALLTNYGTKIFCALGDEESAKYASSLVGRDFIHTLGSTRTGQVGLYEEILGNLSVSTAVNQHIAELVLPRLFMNGLRTGGPENGLMVDAWIIKNGMPFANGSNAMLVEFSQK